MATTSATPSLRTWLACRNRTASGTHGEPLTLTQDFEQSIVHGKAHWITSVVHEPASSRLVIWLTDNEESFKPTRVIEFIDVQEFDSQWTDRQDDWIEGLLGAHEKQLTDLVHYLLVTDQREIELITRTKAAIRSAPP